MGTTVGQREDPRSKERNFGRVSTPSPSTPTTHAGTQPTHTYPTHTEHTQKLQITSFTKLFQKTGVLKVSGKGAKTKDSTKKVHKQRKIKRVQKQWFKTKGSKKETGHPKRKHKSQKHRNMPMKESFDQALWRRSKNLL